ncbi:1-acylglycerol-3-phosphate O-acyltransferase [Pichia californica]|uniref:1-acyl-sn-glycerol-3-phosphate acyltransferase n=1 Tax=Pichia californica TaxID=460514 RepID=A0A9P7BH70_9ASCO|nr:1-acylglycerol-3-phosphate O-acyltransferase [[Candida] californica]KAG0690931.1 1-acylglycerol-3-phosphate O-acyltransferase [[Candida] californica]
MSFFGNLFKKIKFITKGIVALNVLLVSATYGVLCSIYFTIIRKRDLAQWSTARFYYYLFSFIMGMKINVDKPELLEKLPAILISNHQSELDIYMLGRIFPQKCVVTAKKQLKYIPFLGWFMSASGTFFLDRSNRESAIHTLNNALNTLKENKGGLFMFPEGTRSYSSNPILLPFKKGAFHLAVQAQIPIIPIVVSNTSNLYSIKLFNFNSGEINIKVLDPIPTEGLTKDDVPKLTEEVYEKMNNVVKELGMSNIYGEHVSLPENEYTEEGEIELNNESNNVPASSSTDGTLVSESTSLLKN